MGQPRIRYVRFIKPKPIESANTARFLRSASVTLVFDKFTFSTGTGFLLSGSTLPPRALIALTLFFRFEVHWRRHLGPVIFPYEHHSQKDGHECETLHFAFQCQKVLELETKPLSCCSSVKIAYANPVGLNNISKCHFTSLYASSVSTGTDPSVGSPEANSTQLLQPRYAAVSARCDPVPPGRPSPSAR